MSIRGFLVCVLNCALILSSAPATAGERTRATKLIYQEFEQGVAPYQVTYTVTADYIRIDDESDKSGL